MKAAKGMQSVMKTHEEFLNELKVKRFDLFTSIEIVSKYKGNKEKIFFNTKFGLCGIQPNDLIKSKKIGIDSAVDKTAYYKNMLKDRIEEIYDYSLIDYVNATTKIDIICEDHGIFPVNPNNFLNKVKCPNCAKLCMGWTKSKWKEAGLRSKNFDGFKCYIVKCWNDDYTEVFYKIGRTFNTIKHRFRFIPYNYKPIKIIESEDSDYIFDMETKLHKQYKDYKYIPNTEFKGKHECFSELPNLSLTRELIK